MQVTENTILEFGPYKGTALKNVPEKYLRIIYVNPRNNVPQVADVKEYTRINIIEKEKIVEKKRSQELPECAKKIYPTQKEAKFELKRISATEQKHKKPNRAYECPICSGWHLTSKPIIGRTDTL